MEKNRKKIIKKNQIDFFIILIEWSSVSVSRRMFQSAISPIRDTEGDDTINIVSRYIWTTSFTHIHFPLIKDFRSVFKLTILTL